jgi:hypothetical protein
MFWWWPPWRGWRCPWLWLALTNPQYRYLFPWLTPQYELALLEYWEKMLDAQLSAVRARIAELKRQA